MTIYSWVALLAAPPTSWATIAPAVITGIFGTLLGTIVTAIAAHFREKGRLEEERKQKREERLLEERISAYANIATVSRLVFREIGKEQWAKANEHMDELGNAVSVIQLIGETQEDARPAEDLHLLLFEAVRSEDEADRDFEQQYLDRRAAFITAAKSDLGI